MAKQHTKEFQQEAVRIALSSDLSRKQIDARLGTIIALVWQVNVLKNHFDKDQLKTTKSE